MKTVKLSGAIVDAWFDDEWFAPEIEKGLLVPSNRVVREIENADTDAGVELFVNSPGGIVDAAHEITVALEGYRARGGAVRIVVGALAASAAAEIVLRAPTGSEVLAHKNSRLMFHAATVAADGGADTHRAAISDLESVNQPMIDLLVEHGLPRAKVEAAFRDGGALWLSAKAAEELGIVDSILGDEAEAPALADPEQAARIAKPTAQLERLADRIPMLSRVSRLAALGVAEPDPATILDAAPAEPEAPEAAPHPATDQPEAPSADSAPAPAEPAPEDPATPEPAPAAEPEPLAADPAPAPAPEAEEPAGPAAEPAPAPEAPPAPDERVEALRASLEKAEASARSIQSASGKKIAALERDLAAAIAERDAARAELETTRQSISDLTARAEALASLVETERDKRASLAGGVLAPESTVDTSVPPASATPCSDALDAIPSLDDRRAFAKAHAAELAAERAAAKRPRRR